MRTHHRLDVSLTLIGPILTHGSDGAPGIDAPMARDSQGRFLLPFSLVKGKVVDALRELRPADPKVKDWLGQATPDGTWEPERGRLRFSDFITQVKGAGQVIERIQINQDTGATAGQMLMMTEAPFGYGEEVLFTGTIEFIAEAKEAGEIRDTLDVAL